MPEVHRAYEEALRAIDRPPRKLVVLDPANACATDGPRWLLILVGGRAFNDLTVPALALVFAPGEHVLGRSHPGSPFPKQVTNVLLFEGHQCLLSVSDRVVVTRDVSTNGTWVLPPDVVRGRPRIGPDELRASPPHWPRVVSPHDLVVTIYAELVLVRSRCR
ncbi:MAG: hypothetical protein ACOZIN_12845 [Myxococcota bacterium]